MPPLKKPEGMSWESFSEHLIAQAQAAGEFDNLPGFGKPLPDLDRPHDDAWWVKQTARREKLNLLPPGLAIRVDVQQTMSRVWAAPSEEAVRAQLVALNERIAQANFACVSGPPSDVALIDVESTVAEWRDRRNAG